MGPRCLVLICDGKRTLWDDLCAIPTYEKATKILDVSYVCEHLSRAAEAVFGKAAPGAKRWFEKYLQDAVITSAGSVHTLIVAFSVRRKIIFAFVPVVVVAVVLEVGARFLMGYVLPAVGSRGDQFREILTVQFNVPQDEADLLVRYDPDLFWALQPNTPDVEIHHAGRLWLDPATNARGLRDDPLVSPKPPMTVRVLCVGDSCTYGSGVRRSDSVPDLLEKRLAAALSADAGLVDVVNAGVPGYTAHQAVAWLDRDGWAMEPDVVVLTVGFNDRRSWGGRTDEAHAAAESDRRSGLSGLLYASRFVQVFTQVLKAATGTHSADRSQAARTMPRVPTVRYVELLAHATLQARDAGAAIVFVLWPVASNLKFAVDRKLTTHQQALVAFCAERDLPLVDPIKALRPFADEVYLFDDVHMTPKGNRIVARQIAAAVVEALAER